MKKQISYQLDASTIQMIARIADIRGVSESALVDLILKDHMTEYYEAEARLKNLSIDHLVDSIERSRKRKK